ncbi:MAG: hypothetical protein ACREF1_01495, partial [Acetobacteraceae bacterium]
MPTSTTPLTLSHNPTTITNAYSVSAASAIYGPAPTAWSVTNTTTIQNLATTITNTITPASGISLANGGTVSNNADATIEACGIGVAITGTAGTVVNAGSIASTGSVEAVAALDGLVSNASGGTISGYAGVALGALKTGGSYGLAGSLTNAAGGVISGQILTTGGLFADGVIAANGPGTVTNSGNIRGTTGVWLEAGGTLTNAADATISGRTNGVRSGLITGQTLPTT